MPSRRNHLPNRRLAETFDFMSEGLAFKATVARFPDGRLAEIFLSNHKAGSMADTAARDSAIVASIALQHGADIDVIRKALCRDSRGNPNGPLGVALDFVARQSGL
jgi:hypothetical protein